MAVVKDAAANLSAINEGARLGYSRPSEAFVIEINVGGELVYIPKDTICLAPEDTEFRRMLGASSADKLPVAGSSVGIGDGKNDQSSARYTWVVAKAMPRDGQGRLFLNFPSRVFRMLMDHLRLIEIAPEDGYVRPPLVPLAMRFEAEELAWHLGLGYLLDTPQRGRGPPADSEIRGGRARPRAAILEDDFGRWPFFSCARRRRGGGGGGQA